MKRATPTTQSMLAFAASARHLSFTKAAVELCVTQGAVSRQVQGLELFVRVALFDRLNPGLSLTTAGRAYLPRVEAALIAIETATLELLAFGGQRNQVSVACHPTLAASWLLPRLPAFRQKFPGLTMNLMPPAWHEPLPQNIDIAIRFGHSEHDWPGLEAHYLLGREFLPLVAPSVSETKARKVSQAVSRTENGNAQRTFARTTRGLADHLASQTLLHHVQVPDAWLQALALLGIPETQVNAYAGPRFAQFSTLLQAAATGFGVAIAPVVLATEWIENGRLVALVDTPVSLVGGYFACIPPSRHSDPVVRESLAWLMHQGKPG